MDPLIVIEKNQELALEHIDEILGALRKWKRWDYDANGRNDFPLCDLKKLVDTRFVNGEKLELISERLAKSDLRYSPPVEIDGYYFTLTHWEKSWPSSGMVKECQILAIPAVLGKTGSCSFYVNTENQAYFSNFKLDKKVPKWPDQRQLDAGVWVPFKRQP